MNDFIDEHRSAHGVEPICKVRQVALSGYRRHAALQREPHRRCARAQRDDALVPQIERVWRTNMQVYGADKLAREGTSVARCTVERLMRQLGLRGVMRGKVVRTTISDNKAPCPLDRVNRQFQAERPNQLWVSDFTYVSTWQGWLYVAFVIDVFARRIVGWRVSSLMRTDRVHGIPFRPTIPPRLPPRYPVSTIRWLHTDFRRTDMDRLPDFETYRANALAKGYDEVLERRWAPGTVTGTHSLAFEVSAVLAQGEMWLEQGPISAPMVPGSGFELKPNVLRSERYGPESALFSFACRHAKEQSA